MMTREELEAALGETARFSPVIAAARKQLALMPEKCETCGGKGLQHSNPGSLCNHPCPTCHGSGKAYPQETVETIAVALFLADHPLMENTWNGWEDVERLRGKYLALAVAVLDALGDAE